MVPIIPSLLIGEVCRIAMGFFLSDKTPPFV
jgi:hypothetical protein